MPSVFRDTADKGEFHFERRLALYLKLCQDPALDRTAIHVAAILLLKHTNSHTAKTVPGVETIAAGMGRSARTVGHGIRSLKVRWLRQVRRVGTSASYEWNWDAVSDEEWQAATTTCRSVRKPSLPIRAEDKAAESNRKTTLPIHIKMNLEEEKPEAQSVSSTTGDDEGANPSVDSKSGNEPQSTITGSDFHIAQAETSDIAQVGTSYTENDTAPPTDIEQAFADFSRHYPATNHSESQHIVRAAFLRAVKAGADPEAIITGASRYASVRDGHDPQYTMAPTNWLRQRRWECLPATTSIAPITTIGQHGNPIPAPAPATAPPRPPTAFEQSVRKGIAKGLTQTSLFIRPVSNGKDHQ